VNGSWPVSMVGMRTRSLVEGGRLRFKYSHPVQIWKSWCANRGGIRHSRRKSFYICKKVFIYSFILQLIFYQAVEPSH